MFVGYSVIRRLYTDQHKMLVLSVTLLILCGESFQDGFHGTIWTPKARTPGCAPAPW